ncbi:MAG: Ldh family oxidoreductase [Burkholderiales bacterium]|nr:Ldh family oxidoreductase [Burkholderiales bacterium]
MPALPISELQALAQRALARAGANPAMAESTARALVAAEAQGLVSHGLSRVPQYAGFLENGRADGQAVPAVARAKGGAVLVDARGGLAFAACDLAVAEAIARARSHGVAFAGVTNSHHFGVAAYHLEAVGAQGLVGIAMGNSPAAMPMAGGRRALFGTNPIAAVFPRRDAAPISLDLSLSEVARGKIMIAAQRGEPIPPGWALDRHGQPTTDAQAAIDGMMVPAGGTKGALLALMVELLVVALTGARFGFEADSFLVAAGNRPNIGQAFIVVDPDALAGSDAYLERVETLLAAMLADDGVRIPGSRRNALAARAAAHGLSIPDALAAQLRALAGAPVGSGPA